MTLLSKLSYEGRIRLGCALALVVGLGAAWVPYGWALWVALGLLGVWAVAQGTWYWKRVPAKLPIFLMLHAVNDDVVDASCANNSIRPAELERLIVDLKQAGYTFQTAYEAATTPCHRAVAMTFDDGYADNYTELFPILKRHAAKATLFVTSRGETDATFMTPAQIREMADSGLVEFGGHTAGHTPLGQHSEAEARKAIGANLEWLEKILGEKVKTFAYPCGQYTPQALKVLGELGIPYAFTMHKKMRPVAEAPLLIHRQIIPRGKTPLQNYLLATRGRCKI